MTKIRDEIGVAGVFATRWAVRSADRFGADAVRTPEGARGGVDRQIPGLFWRSELSRRIPRGSSAMLIPWLLALRDRGVEARSR